MRIKCKHADNSELIGGFFMFDFNIGAHDERDTLILCEDCYNRLIGVVVKNLVGILAYHLGRVMKCQ